MIKFYCDKCGKEITGNVNTVVEETQAVDRQDNVVATWTDTVYYCDECQYEELNYGFKIGDEVITYDGRVGSIIDICTCDRCKERGFFEPEVQYNDGGTDYIMISAKNNGFKDFYKIGDQIFGNLDDRRLLARILGLREELKDLEEQLTVVNKLKKITIHI